MGKNLKGKERGKGIHQKNTLTGRTMFLFLLAPNTPGNDRERYERNTKPVIGKMLISNVKQIYCKKVLLEMDAGYAGGTIRHAQHFWPVGPPKTRQSYPFTDKAYDILKRLWDNCNRHKRYRNR